MARKLSADSVGPVRRKSVAAVDQTAEELRILRPDLTIGLAGDQIVVREYTFWESMDVVYRDRSFLDDVVELLAADDRDPWEAVRALFGRHAGYLKAAAAAATGRDVAWVEGLSPRETDLLMSTWWAVNGHFFIHEATVVIRGRMARSARDGRKSSSVSPPPGSATSIASDDAPSGS